MSVGDFQIDVEQRTALCPASKRSTQCSRLVEQAAGDVDQRFEFRAQSHACPLRERCLGTSAKPFHRLLSYLGSAPEVRSDRSVRFRQML